MIYKDDDAVIFQLALTDNIPVQNALKIYTLLILSRPFFKQWTFYFWDVLWFCWSKTGSVSGTRFQMKSPLANVLGCTGKGPLLTNRVTSCHELCVHPSATVQIFLFAISIYQRHQRSVIIIGVSGSLDHRGEMKGELLLLSASAVILLSPKSSSSAADSRSLA